jgi:hypothetical protein
MNYGTLQVVKFYYLGRTMPNVVTVLDGAE